MLKQFQISFQEFKTKLLEPGLVDRVVVSNKSVAKVYVKESPNINQIGSDAPQDLVLDAPRDTVNGNSRRNVSQYKYYFTIGSADTFEKKLEETQDSLGIDPHNYVPVIYISEMNWVQELLKFGPTILLLGSLFYMGRKMQGGLGVGGPGGKGGRGIFSIGKAHVTKMDKNSKNKVELFFI